LAAGVDFPYMLFADQIGETVGLHFLGAPAVWSTARSRVLSQALISLHAQSIDP
jgi:hypothetical protein